jgi:FlaA1/EpsC-like NDP-sugar epimerase
VSAPLSWPRTGKLWLKFMARSFVRWILKFAPQNGAGRAALLALIYVTTVALCFWAAYEIRFDFDVPPTFQSSFLLLLLAAVSAKLVGLLAFHQFDGLLTYFGKPDLKRLVQACTIGSLPLAFMSVVRSFGAAPPRGVVLIDFVLCIMALAAVRLSFGYLRSFVFWSRKMTESKARLVGIVGAGEAGAELAKHMMNDPSLGLHPVAFFDDNSRPHSSMHGIPVFGTPERILECKAKLRIEEIIIAMPSAPARRIRQVLELARAAGLECKTVPSLGQLATGRVSISNLRPVKIEDLLGRIPVRIKTDAVRDLLKARTVMVTGAGGSIGSELCRQMLSFNPGTLVLVERSEPHVFAIEQELLASRNGTSIVPLLGDITSSGRMRYIFDRFRPQVIFHAAAHKHVPMMEHQPAEAIRNNVLGTALLSDLAIEYGIDRFVLISTDKAVNPSSVMGATKRCAEIYLESLMTRSHTTKFTAVRFGNVLGSSGSVVPTFAKQIAAGGPVTVTHPQVSRFFMTIPEAVTLVLEAFALGQGGDIFMLDMGEPIRIVDLAMQMIRLSGLKPHEDIEIVFTGLRPGEKLEEVLSYRLENVTQTEHPQISRLVSPVQDYNYVRPLIDRLALAAEDLELSADELKELLVKAAPEYTPFITQRVETSCVEVRELVGEKSAGVLPALHGIAPEHS